MQRACQSTVQDAHARQVQRTKTFSCSSTKNAKFVSQQFFSKQIVRKSRLTNNAPHSLTHTLAHKANDGTEPDSEEGLAKKAGGGVNCALFLCVCVYMSMYTCDHLLWLPGVHFLYAVLRDTTHSFFPMSGTISVSLSSPQHFFRR